MMRWLRRLLVLASLLLFLAITLAWPLSYWRHDSAALGRTWFAHDRLTQYALAVETSKGGLHISWSYATATPADFDWSGNPDNTGRWNFIGDTGGRHEYPHFSNEVAPGLTFLGFAFGYAGAWPTGHLCELILPYPFLFLLFAIASALALRATLRRRREKRLGLCPVCSYDLRAHRPGDKCPECGTTFSKAPTSTPA